MIPHDAERSGRMWPGMWGHLAAAVIYFVITITLTWPLAIRFADHVPHDLGDPLLSTWVLWWNAQIAPFTAAWWDGMAFFPARNTLTFSDHRVGLGLIATPVLWLTQSPIAAYNTVFLASFALSAITAYLLCFVVTRHHGASFIGGLVFGFNPYRADHVSHLELLASFWLPIIFLALHRFAKGPTWRWAGVLAFALLMQALTSGYYFVFAGVLLGLWLLWFRPWPAKALNAYTKLAVAIAAPILAITPVLMRYHEAHTAMGLSRTIHEIEEYSADIAGLLVAPDLLWLWNVLPEWRTPEGALFPGLTAVVLVVAGLMMGRTEPLQSPSLRWRRLRLGLLAGSALAGGAALVPIVFGPTSGFGVSLTGSYKPLSICILLLIAWILTSSRALTAWKTRSMLGFYVFATLAMWIFALGPTARLLGNRIFYKAPYSWLMLIPSVRDEFRVPARFAMLAVLALAVAAAIAWCRLMGTRPARRQWSATVLIASAVMAESWISPFLLAAVPPPLVIPPQVPSHAAVLELPMGVFEDGTAMFQSIGHRRRTVNGLSGYAPPHYIVLSESLKEGRFEVIRELARFGEIAVFSRRADTPEVTSLIASRTGGHHLATTSEHDVLLVPQVAQPIDGMLDQPIPIREISSDVNAPDVHLMLDTSARSAWVTSQNGGETFVADLGRIATVTGTVQQTWLAEFPRGVSIGLRLHDHEPWTEVWRGETASRSLAAVLRGGAFVNLSITFPGRQARFVRVQQVGQSESQWAVAEFQVLGKM